MQISLEKIDLGQMLQIIWGIVNAISDCYTDDLKKKLQIFTSPNLISSRKKHGFQEARRTLNHMIHAKPTNQSNHACEQMD